jgi:hypothetical protein
MKVGSVHKNALEIPESGPENEPFMEFLPEITSAGAEVILPTESRNQPFPEDAIWPDPASGPRETRGGLAGGLGTMTCLGTTGCSAETAIARNEIARGTKRAILM